MKKTVCLPADPMPCLFHAGDVSRGRPQMAMWPKAPMRVGPEEIVVDVLVRLDYPGHDPQIVVVEIDEQGVTPASRRRERLLAKVGIPVVRLTSEDILRPDYGEHFDNLLRAAAARGTGRITRVLGYCA